MPLIYKVLLINETALIVFSITPKNRTEKSKRNISVYNINAQYVCFLNIL